MESYKWIAVLFMPFYQLMINSWRRKVTKLKSAYLAYSADLLGDVFWNPNNQLPVKSEKRKQKINIMICIWINSQIFLNETYDFGPVFQTTLSPSMTYASSVICHCPPVATTVLNCPDGPAAGCIFVKGIIKLPVKKSRCGLTVCVNVIVSLGILKSFVFGDMSCEVSVNWTLSMDRYKLGVFA